MNSIDSQQLLMAMYAQSLDGIFFMMLPQSVRWDDSADKDAVLDYVLTHQRITYGNPAFYAQHRAPTNDLIGRTPLDFYQDAAEAKRNWRAFMESGHLHTTLKIQRTDGSPLWLEGDYTWLKGNEGDYIGCFGIQRDITERKQIEQMLRDDQVRYQALFNQSHDAVYILDLQGRHIIANQRATDMVGYTLEELQTLSYVETTAERTESEGVLQRLLAGEKVPLYKRMFVRKSGEHFPAEVNVEIVRDSEGTPIYIQSLVRDISDREALAAELTRRAAHAEALNHVIDACIASNTAQSLFHAVLGELRQVLGLDGGVLWTHSEIVIQNVSPELVKVCGLLSERRLPLNERFVVEDWTTFQESDPTYEVTRQVSLRLGVRATLLVALTSGHKRIGSLVIIHSQPHMWLPEEVALAEDVGRQVGIAVERLALIQALNDSQTRYRTFNEMMADYACIIRINADQCIHLEWEREGTLAQITGYSYDEFMSMGGPLFAVVPEDRAKAKPNWSPDMQVEDVEFRLHHKDGRIRWLRRVTQGEGSQESGVLGRLYQTLSDITERKRLEEQERVLVREQERSHILSSFIRDASHEFRTPLSILNLNIHVLKQSIQDDRQLKRLETMAHQIHVSNDLIDDLLTLSRIDSNIGLDLEPLDINWLLADVLDVHRLYAQQKSLTFSLICYPSLPQIHGDADYFTIAIHKLLDNAVRYTAEGGITVRTGLENNYVVVEVQDTGMGMSPETQEHIFERFFRLDDAHSEQGFGLGLPIVRGIVELHHGHIRIDSKEGKGSTVRVYFPVS